MYKFIVNPLTGRMLNLFGKEGKLVLTKYINQSGGLLNLGRYETKAINCKGKILHELGKGSYKKAYTINCGKNQWTSKAIFFKGSSKFNKNFTEENCLNSTVVITNENKKNFYNEIDIQKKLSKKPKIYQYGKCKDTDKFDKVDSDGIHYKIEDKFTTDLQKCINDRLFFMYNLSIDLEKELNFKKSFKELFKQIKYFNKKGYGHFDIKPANIGVYLTDNGLIESLNFIDFGLADKLGTEGLRGTLGFLDPVDIQHSKVLTKEMDLFALGMTLLNTLFDKNPIFSYLKSSDQRDYINEGLNIEILPKIDESSDEWIRRIYKVDLVKKDDNLDIIECNKFCKNTVHNKSEWRKCYLKASRKYHPDKQFGKNNADKASSSETFKALQNCDDKMNEELLSSNVIENAIFKYPITLNLIYYLFVSDYNYRYSVEQILNHSFWNSNFNSEEEDWIKTPEYKLQNKIISDREERIVQLEAERVESLVNEFGYSELGCHCTGPCGYQNICDAISGLCSYKKKCPVEPEYCDGEYIDRCGINR